MASRRAHLLVALGALAVLAALIGSTQSASCCLRYVKHRLPCRRLLNYTIQTINTSCDINAVIFQTLRRFVCADPLLDWVQKGMQCVDEKRRKTAKVFRGDATIQ